MIKYWTILFSLVLLTTVSCKNRHKVAKAEAEMEALSTEGSDSTVVNDAFADLEDEFDFEDDSTSMENDTIDEIFASMERGACFGRCPIYKMYIYESGKATYEGINFVDLMGAYQTTFTAKELADISANAREYGLDTMALEYDKKGVTDLPTAMIGVTFDGEYKKIKMRYGYPQSLRTFRDYFEELLKSKEWEAVPSSRQ